MTTKSNRTHELCIIAKDTKDFSMALSSLANLFLVSILSAVQWPVFHSAVQLTSFFFRVFIWLRNMFWKKIYLCMYTCECIGSVGHVSFLLSFKFYVYCWIPFLYRFVVWIQFRQLAPFNLPFWFGQIIMKNENRKNTARKLVQRTPSRYGEKTVIEIC